MSGFVFGGMVLGCLGFFLAITTAVVAKDAWMLLIFPGLFIAGGVVGVFIDIFERRPRP